MTAEVVAQARRIFLDASAKHAAAEGKVRNIRDRIEWSKARQADITNRRLAGTATEADTAEFAALAGDLETLGKMLAEAQAAADALEPTQERNQLTLAEQQHAREQAEADYQALAAKAAELDAALCRAIHATHAAGRKLGHVALSQSWRPSEPLQRALAYGVAP